MATKKNAAKSANTPATTVDATVETTTTQVAAAPAADEYTTVVTYKHPKSVRDQKAAASRLSRERRAFRAANGADAVLPEHLALKDASARGVRTLDTTGMTEDELTKLDKLRADKRESSRRHNARLKFRKENGPDVPFPADIAPIVRVKAEPAAAEAVAA
jgi:hypothetical protein